MQGPIPFQLLIVDQVCICKPEAEMQCTDHGTDICPSYCMVDEVMSLVIFSSKIRYANHDAKVYWSHCRVDEVMSLAKLIHEMKVYNRKHFPTGVESAVSLVLPGSMDVIELESLECVPLIVRIDHAQEETFVSLHWTQQSIPPIGTRCTQLRLFAGGGGSVLSACISEKNGLIRCWIF